MRKLYSLFRGRKFRKETIDKVDDQDKHRHYMIVDSEGRLLSSAYMTGFFYIHGPIEEAVKHFVIESAKNKKEEC